MEGKLLQKARNVPTEERALARLRRAVELHELEDLPILPGMFIVPRYLVTYMNSDTSNVNMRAATVVSITNQSGQVNRVSVAFFRGLSNNAAPVGTAAFSIPSQFTVDFATRHLPSELTVVNAVPNPELNWIEGRAVVSSTYPEIAVSARVYYTAGERDESLHAITDCKVVVYGQGNNGD